jgi:predicted dehydrogenase
MKRPISTGPNRRDFLKRAAAASVAVVVPSVIPSAALGRGDAVAPSERITLGFIGIGMMGRGHLGIFLNHPQTQVVAVCDVDQWRREHAQTSVEQAYAARRASGAYRGADAYRDLRQLLARHDIDAVVIATGDNWHGPATVMAAKAGKDIYCEKPISKTIREARAMVETARRYGRVVQIGLQQRSTPEFIRACRLVRSGRIGKLKMVYVVFPGTSSDVNLPAELVPEGLDWDLWLGAAPWHPFNSQFHHYGPPPFVVPWHFCRDFGGGNLTSNAVHSFDVVQWGLGMDESGPVEITPPETGKYPSLTYKYANDVLLQVVDSKLDGQKHLVPQGWDLNTRIENFGALFVGSEGWIHVGREGYLKGFPPEIIERSPQRRELGEPVANHHQNWLDCIRSRQEPACDVAVGCRSTIVAHLGCIAHWTGRTLKWDPAKEQFVGDDEANRLRFRAMREPWSI